jgi:hypothetical protein
MAGDLRWGPSQQSTCILIIRGVEGDNGGLMRLLIGRTEPLPACHSVETLTLAVAHVWFWIWCCTRNLVTSRSLRTSIGQGCEIKLGDEDACLPPSADVMQSWYRACLPLNGHNRWGSKRVYDTLRRPGYGAVGT